MYELFHWNIMFNLMFIKGLFSLHTSISKRRVGFLHIAIHWTSVMQSPCSFLLLFPPQLHLLCYILTQILVITSFFLISYSSHNKQWFPLLFLFFFVQLHSYCTSNSSSNNNNNKKPCSQSNTENTEENLI